MKETDHCPAVEEGVMKLRAQKPCIWVKEMHHIRHSDCGFHTALITHLGQSRIRLSLILGVLWESDVGWYRVQWVGCKLGWVQTGCDESLAEYVTVGEYNSEGTMPLPQTNINSWIVLWWICKCTRQAV